MAHDDPAKEAEHAAVMALVPLDAVDVRAVQSGVWNDPATWEGGMTPVTGENVLIHPSILVVVDSQEVPRLRTIRVDGELGFLSAANTRLLVDTMIVAPSGKLTIGTAQDPVAGSVEIIFIDSGPIDTVWDPTSVSRGLISHGVVSIQGREKTSWGYLRTAPRAGDGSLDFVDVPTEWEVGDTLLIPGINWEAHQDELRTFTGIVAGKVMLDTPLAYDHLTPADDGPGPISPPLPVAAEKTFSGLTPGNYRLSVAPDVSSAGFQVVGTFPAVNSLSVRLEPVNAPPPPPSSSILLPVANLTRNILFRSESQAVDRRGHAMLMHGSNISVGNLLLKDMGRTDKSLPLSSVDAPSENRRGRYALHFHRCDQDHEAIDVKGVVAWGSPGWGVVNHSSNVNVHDSVAHDCFGAGFVSEAGDETGSFRNNMAAGSIGAPEIPQSRQATGDFGHIGSGFWLQGPNVIVEGNVAVGNPNNYVVYGEGYPEPDTLKVANPTGHLTPLVGFRDNLSIGAAIGYTFYGISHNQPEPSVVERLTSWNDFEGMSIRFAHLDPHECNVTGAGISGYHYFGGYQGTGTVHGGRCEGRQYGLLAPTDGNGGVQGGIWKNNGVDIHVWPLGVNRDLTFADVPDAKFLFTIYDGNLFDDGRFYDGLVKERVLIDGRQIYAPYQLRSFLRTVGRFADLTNQQVFDQHGLKPTGYLAPAEVEPFGNVFIGEQAQ